MQKIEGLEDQMECSDVMLALILFIDDEIHDEVEVEIFGQRCKAVVQDDQPLWDPKNERLRS